MSHASSKIRVTLTVEEALLAAELLTICKGRIHYPGFDTDERWQIAGQLAVLQHHRIESAADKLRAAARRARR